MLKNSKNISLFGLPEEVSFCKNCVESNQRMMGSSQLNIKKNESKEGVAFDEKGVCLSCRYFEKKETVNWSEREKELIDTLDRYRKTDGSYDVLLPGSGGKDSQFLSYILKYKYNMNPLTITWAPNMYTDIGQTNFNTWISNGFDNILYTPNTKVHKKLTQLAFKNLLHPFQPFVIGQYHLAPKIALQYGIKLIVIGDSYQERGYNSFDQHLKCIEVHLEKHHILIAEDENDIMEFLIDLLEEDFKITSVPDVPAGLEEIEKQEFDIVITDLRMPGGSGLDILARAKQKSKDTEVIIITGYGTLETVTEAMKLGISSYLLKPFSTQEFFGQVIRA